jgi:serine phosphatase RsbU (regulator of sigma subunit)/tetratricopeptide (TPR) repeat protein
MKNYISILLLLISGYVSGQRNFDLDSLAKRIESKDDRDTTKVLLMNELAWDISYQNLDSGLVIVNRALELARKNGYENGESEGLNVQGTIYLDLGRYADAVKSHLSAIRIREKRGRPDKLGESYHNLALVYESMDSIRLSLDYQRRAYDYYMKADDSSGIGPIASYIGNILILLDSSDAAIPYFMHGAAVARQYNLHHWMAENTAGLAYCYAMKGDIVRARMQMTEAFEFERIEYNDYNMMGMWISNARLLKLEKKYDEAIASVDSALAIAIKLNVHDARMQHYNLLSELYELQGNPSQALLYAKRHQVLKDSILSTKNQQLIRNLEAVYEKEKQEQQLEILRQDDQLQKILVTGGIVFTLGFIVVAFLLFGRIRMGKIAGQLLQEKKAIIESKNKDIIDSINYARRIQDAVTPAQEQLTPAFRHAFVYNRPKEIVSGDFWWTAETAEYYFVAAGDCSGHGVPGSFMSVMTASFLNGIIIEQQINDPAEVLFELNEKVRAALQHSGTHEDTPLVKDTIDIAVCRVDKQKQKLAFSSAVMSVTLIRSDQIIEYRGSETSVGAALTNASNPYRNEIVNLDKGDTVFMYSDGLTAMMNRDPQRDALNELLLSLQTSAEQKHILDSTLGRIYPSGKTDDDILVIGFGV